MYLVKKDIVQEVSSVWDYLIKRLDLEPLINLLQSILGQLIELVQSQATLKAFMEFLDEVEKRMKFFQKFGL